MKGCFYKVPHCLRVSTAACITIRHPCKLQNLFGSWSSYDPRSSWRRNQPNSDTSTLPCDFNGQGMGQSNLVSPVASPYRDDAELGHYHSSFYGDLDFLACLPPESHMSVAVSYCHEGFEPRALPTWCLLLHRLDLHNVVFQFIFQKEVYDLELFDGERVQEDFLD